MIEQARTHKYKPLSVVANKALDQISPWARAGAVLHFADTKPGIPAGTPAWYDLEKGDIYIHLPSIVPNGLLDGKDFYAEESDRELLIQVQAFHHSIDWVARNRKSSDPFTLASHLPRTSRSALAHGGAAPPTRFTHKHLNIIGGLIQHEAAHSAWSGWMVSAQEAIRRNKVSVIAVMRMFEELRIEWRVINSGRDISDGFFLRASYGWLLEQADLSKMPHISKRDLSTLWALSYGRSIAGVIDPSEALDIDTAARYGLTDNVVDELKLILQLVVKVKTNNPHTCAATLATYAQRWLELVGEETSGEVPDSFEGSGGEGEEGEEVEGSGRASGASGDGDGTNDGEDGSGGGDGDDEARSAGTKEVITKVTIDDGTTGIGDAEDKKTGARKTSETGTTEVNRGHGFSDTVADSFSEVSTDAKMIVRAVRSMSRSFAGARPARKTLTNPQRAAADIFKTPRTSRAWEEKDPSGEIRNKVMKVAHRLEIVSMPAVSTRRVPSAIPPGRLNMRSAVRKSADRDAGRISTVDPWKKKARTHAPIRPTTIGVMTDISGSMKWAQNYVADFAYVYSNAGRRISAKTAAITFGATVELVTRPGEVLTKVKIRSADDGHEKFDLGAASLDGMLNLTSDTRAVRVVLVVSDAHYVASGEADKCVQWLTQWSNSGVHVVWLGITDDELTVPKAIRSIKNVHIVNMDEYGDSSGYWGFDPSSAFDPIEMALKQIEELSV